MLELGTYLVFKKTVPQIASCNDIMVKEWKSNDMLINWQALAQ